MAVKGEDKFDVDRDETKLSGFVRLHSTRNAVACL
jgi:hypothetical protein